MGKRRREAERAWQMAGKDPQALSVLGGMGDGQIGFPPYNTMQSQHLAESLGQMNARAVYTSAAVNSIAALAKEMEELSQISPCASEACQVILRSVTLAAARDIAEKRW